MPRKQRREACAQCRSSSSELVRLSCCSFTVCWACLVVVCTNAVPSASEVFASARCSGCGCELPLDVVQDMLPKALFQRYRRLWLETRADCVSCASVMRKTELRLMSCGHFYCGECVRRMCRLALGDRALVPVQCCQKELPMDYIYEGLPAAADRATYERFLREKNWRASELVSDFEYAKVVARAGGKQCPGCGVGVQRDFGCVHIKCPNGHDFCFTCLRAWRTCTCPLIPDAELSDILGD